MSIYSNDNISKIAKLTTRELPHLAKNSMSKITVRENNGVYSTFITGVCKHLAPTVCEHKSQARKHIPSLHSHIHMEAGTRDYNV